MNCFECATTGSDRTAVALCRHCNAGLCLDHLREAASVQSRGVTNNCSHETWHVASWPQQFARNL
jgi:hypothetical protein